VAEGYAAKPRIEVSGQPLDAEVELKLDRVEVDDHVSLPDMFLLRFRDPERDLLERSSFEIGSEVRILAARQGKEADELIMAGEITSLEGEFDPSGSHVFVRGYDQSHRLHRGERTETYRNVTDSDIARTVAQRAGIQVGRIDESTGVHRLVSQANLSDWDFLSARAREAGFDVTVVDGKLEFKEPVDAVHAPQLGDLASDDPLQLVLGADLETFRSRLTSSEQVSEVQVRGWDPKQQEPVVGTASAATRSVKLAIEPGALASRFGDQTHVVVDRPIATQAEVDASAKAFAEHVASGFAEADGVAKGSPALRAGVAVSIGLTGYPFDGMYTITSTRHVFDDSGYKTRFRVSGSHDRSLLGLVSNGSAGRQGQRILGVVVAKVTNVRDDDAEARVKVAFPWLSDRYESDWVRVVQAGAGAGRGSVLLPEVDDEVLVAFEHGDVRRPFVLGGLYNGQDKPDLGDRFVDPDDGTVARRGFVSRVGHRLVFSDADREEQVLIASGDGSLRIVLDQAATTISFSSDGAVSIEGKEVSIAARSGVKIDGGSGNVTVKGRQIELN
jgi:phage protein D/phage baseplate assembly protein gpV